MRHASTGAEEALRDGKVAFVAGLDKSGHVSQVGNGGDTTTRPTAGNA